MRTVYCSLLTSMLLSTASLAQEGLLDQSFGINGMSFLSMDTLFMFVSDMAVQSDGKIVTVGRCFTDQGWDIYVIRCLADGALDPSFGNMGSVRTDLGTFWDIAFAVTIQADDKILVAAESSTNGLHSTVTLVRYMPDGSLDETFGTNGVATAAPGNHGRPFDLVVKDGGEVLVAGTTAFYNAITVYQFTAAGLPDSSFQMDGTMTISPFGGTKGAFAVRVQNDGKVLLACLYNAGGGYDVAVIRLLPDGAYDAAFGSGGIAALSLTPGDETIGGIGIQSDGGIVMVGTTQHFPNYDMFAARFTPSGTLDTAFGTGGVVVVSTSIGSDRANDLIVQPDDALVITGSSGQVGGVGGAVALIRLTPDGFLDPVFGNAGIVLTPIPNASAPMGVAVDMEPDGRVIVAAGGAAQPVLLRYWAGPLAGMDTHTFDHQGLVAFPNPASDIMTIGFDLSTPGMVSWDMVDAAGRIVLQPGHAQRMAAGSHLLEVDLHQLSPGLHLFRLSTSDRSHTVKVMKE